MVGPRLLLVLGDQLSFDLAALAVGDKTRDIVVMAEVQDEGVYVKHHKKKIILILSAMRKFATALEAQGWTVAYSKLDDPETGASIGSEILRRATQYGAQELIATEPGEFRLIAHLSELPLKTTVLEDTRFIASHSAFEGWAEGRRSLRMEYFYREMRKSTGLLMSGDGPEGGKWNYDVDNRKPAKPDLMRPSPLRFEPGQIVQEVTRIVEDRFADHPGSAQDFWFGTDHQAASEVLDYFIDHNLRNFGDFQDAMLESDAFLHHALISAYLNIGLLNPLEVCQRVEAAYRSGQAPLNAVEGFIRQIIGWREYMRGIYFLGGPDYVRQNALNAKRPLPEFFWTAETDLNCLRRSIGQTLDEAYAHHIQRLMVIGNFALLAGLDPFEVHEWYLAVYWDAFEWVEAPNVIGMSQFADGGVVASKPYVSSGAYIDRMSDYCRGCRYSVKTKMGEGACPFNLLYWAFLDRHEDSFAKNGRMNQIYANWRRRTEEDRRTILNEAEAFLNAL